MHRMMYAEILDFHNVESADEAAAQDGLSAVQDAQVQSLHAQQAVA